MGVIPMYARPGDAGMDLTAATIIDEGNLITYKTGIAMEIPEGYVGLIFPRSSVYKTGMLMSNCVGVIDSGYRGEIQCKFYKNEHSAIFAQGERIAQIVIMPYPQIEFEEVTELSDSERGDKGHGSTGK